MKQTALALSNTEGKITERILSPELRNALADHVPLDLQLRWEQRLKFGDKVWFKNPGGLDLSYWSGDRPVTAVELKWFGSRQLNDSAYDVVKLAAALSEGLVPRAYMLAGAPVDFWNQSRDGAQLFETGIVELDAHLNDFASWFAFWRTETINYPKRLPRSFLTTAKHSEPLTLLSGEQWELRLTEVSCSTGPMERIDYVPTVRPTRGSDHNDLAALHRLKKSGRLKQLLRVDSKGEFRMGEDGDIVDD